MLLLVSIWPILTNKIAMCQLIVQQMPFVKPDILSMFSSISPLFYLAALLDCAHMHNTNF